MKRTSITIPVEIWEELRIVAIRRQMTAGDAVEAAIRAWVNK